jgi:hypothetical protein
MFITPREERRIVGALYLGTGFEGFGGCREKRLMCKAEQKQEEGPASQSYTKRSCLTATRSRSNGVCESCHVQPIGALGWGARVGTNLAKSVDS